MCYSFFQISVLSVLKQIKDARKECAIQFGHGWDLATFASQGEIDELYVQLKTLAGMRKNNIFNLILRNLYFKLVTITINPGASGRFLLWGRQAGTKMLQNFLNINFLKHF